MMVLFVGSEMKARNGVYFWQTSWLLSRVFYCYKHLLLCMRTHPTSVAADAAICYTIGNW